MLVLGHSVMSLREKKSIHLTAALGLQRVKGKKREGQGILERAKNKPKTDVYVPAVSKVRKPNCRAIIPRITAPRTAAQ